MNPLSQIEEFTGLHGAAMMVHRQPHETGRGHSSAFSLEGHSFDRPPHARPGRQLPASPLHPGLVALQGNSGRSAPAGRGGLWFHFLLCHGVGGGIGAQLASWGRHREPGGQLPAQLPEHSPRPCPAGCQDGGWARRHPFCASLPLRGETPR